MPCITKQQMETLPKALCLFVMQCAVICPNCRTTVELSNLESHAGQLRMFQHCPSCEKIFHIEKDPKVEIVKT